MCFVTETLLVLELLLVGPRRCQFHALQSRHQCLVPGVGGESASVALGKLCLSMNVI